MKRVATTDGELRQLQDNVREIVEPWERVPLLAGLLLTDVSLSASATLVAHGLGRKLRGWIVVRTNGTATVYEPSVATLADRFVNLQATGSVVVTLWVF